MSDPKKYEDLEALRAKYGLNAPHDIHDGIRKDLKDAIDAAETARELCRKLYFRTPIGLSNSPIIDAAYEALRSWRVAYD